MDSGLACYAKATVKEDTVDWAVGREAKCERLEDTISAKLFVGNVSFETTKDELERLFSEMGEISEVFVPTDRETGRPRGFAFVEFAEASAAEAATQRFDGYELNGRALRVNEAQERRPRAPRAPGFAPDPGNFGPSPFGGAGGARGGPGKPKGSRRNLRRKKRSL